MIHDYARIAYYLKYLRSIGLAPTNIEIVSESRFWVVNMYDDLDPDLTIHEGVATGVSPNKTTAYLKALSEWTERKCFRQGREENNSACLTRRSDGFAAYPFLFRHSRARARARERALNEATERYAWAKWWDEGCAAATRVLDMSHNPILQDCVPRLDEIDEIYSVRPELSQSTKNLIILVCFFKGGGCTTAGAVEERVDDAIYRASAELVRHVKAARTLMDVGKAESFYEERLLHFRSGKDDQRVRRHLNPLDADPIVLPRLVIDEEVRHRADQHFVVYRCFFEGQPPFIGGAVDRLCI